MRKTLRIFALLAAASMLLWIAGCGGDDDDDDDCADSPEPTVTLSPAGGDVFSNSIITATCSKKVETLTVSGGVVAATGDNKVWTFSLPEGSQSVTVTATDACDATGTASGTYSVGAPDTTAPEIDGGECDPKDGASGVDPADVEEIVLVFSEALASAEVVNFEPEANVDASVDGDTVTIAFLGQFSLSNEQEVVVELDIADLADNTASVKYTFTTMAKEE